MSENKQITMEKQVKEQKIETQKWLIENMIHNLGTLSAELETNDLLLKSGGRRKVGVKHLQDKINQVEKTLKLLRVA